MTYTQSTMRSGTPTLSENHPVASRPGPRAGPLRAVLLATGVLDGRNSAYAAAEIAEPDEGQNFEDDEDWSIRIMGDADTDYTFLFFKMGAQVGGTANVTTDGEGEYSFPVEHEDTTPGTYILQLRAGHDNTTGTPLDTISVVVKEPAP